MTINFHVNINIALQAGSTARASFGVPMLVDEHTITSNRQDGPYSSVAEAEAAGFTASADAFIHEWLTRQFSPTVRRVSQVMIGRRLASENLATALSAIEAVDPSTWYLTNISSRTAADIMALGTWHGSRNKIAVAQSSSADMLAGTASAAQVSTFTVGGTATSGVYSIEVINTWTGGSLGTASVTADVPGTHADNDAIATALRSAWDGVAALAAISASAAGTGADVEITFDGLGNNYTFVLTAPAPGTLVESTPAYVQNPGELTSDANMANLALLYHDDDTEALDGLWSSQCLGFNLDAPMGVGSWAYQQLPGLTATNLTSAQRTQLLAYEANYFAPITMTSGVQADGATFKGRLANGDAIKTRTTMHHTQARMEEALLNVFLSAANSTNPIVPYDDKGIGRLQAAAMSVMNNQIIGGHFIDGALVDGRRTPYIDVPKAADVSATIKQTGVLTMSGAAVIRPEILSVGTPSAVGFSINLSFG